MLARRAFLMAYNFKSLNPLKGLPPCEHVCKSGQRSPIGSG
jgi:hypothetical protein